MTHEAGLVGLIGLYGDEMFSATDQIVRPERFSTMQGSIQLRSPGTTGQAEIIEAIRTASVNNHWGNVRELVIHWERSANCRQRRNS